MTPSPSQGAQLAQPPQPVRPHRRWLHRLGSEPEWPIVLLMVVSAVLSAVAFFLATTFADQAADLSSQARFAAAEESQRQSGLNATLVHDQRVRLDCLSSIQARDAALARYSSRFDDRSIAAVVEHEQRRTALEALLISDVGCATYAVEAALERDRFYRRESGHGDPALLLARSEQFAAAEPISVVAAALFAVVLLLVTLADSSAQRRWVSTWLALAALAAAVAVVLTAVGLWTAGELSGDVVVLLVAIAAVLGVLLLLTGTEAGAAWVRSRLRRRTGWAARMPARRLQAMRREVRWWAEVLGAVTLVVFAVAALGFSLSATGQRQATVRADDFALQAREALELGEQSALAVLGYVQELADLDASSAAEAASGPTGAEGGTDGAPDATREAVLERWAAEKPEWQRVLEASTHRTDCLGRDVLVWDLVADTGDVPLPEAIRAEQRTNPEALSDLVNLGSTGALACSTRAAVAFQEAGEWSDRGSRFTVALVVLGLAGFLFALAADPDRTIRPRRWLLGSAVTGLVVGLAITGAAWLSEPGRVPDADQARGAAAYARSSTARYNLDCETAREAAAEAVATLPRFPRAALLESDAHACSIASEWLIDPSMEPSALDGFRSALERAWAAGLRDSAVTGNLGWANLLAGIGTGEGGPERLREGREQTDAALLEDPTNPFLCFNRAFGTLAAGAREEALQQYREGLAAIRGESGTGTHCVADELDPGLADVVRLSALSDLELLPDVEQHDVIRELLIGGAEPGREQPDPDGTGLSLDTYPQELGLLADEDAPLADADLVVVWYHRVGEDRPWAVVTGPSLWTIQPGRHASYWPINRPVASGAYRADVYAGGQLAARLTTETDWWTSRGLDREAFRWLQLPDLGVSAVVPVEWERLEGKPGVEVTYGSDSGRISFRRSEGLGHEDLDGQAREWSGETWPEDAEDAAAGWYLGLGTTLVRDAESGARVGAGHQRYVEAPADDAAVTASSEDASCPGTTVMTRVEADDPEVRETVWWSQVLVATLPSIEAGSVSVERPFASPSFSIDFPQDWVASACPLELVARSADGSRSLIAGAEPFDGTLDDWFADSTAAYGDEFEGYAEEGRESIVLSNGVAGERLTYTWTSDGTDVRQIQTFAVADGMGYVSTITHRRDEPLPATQAQLLLDSFRPGRTATLVPALCDECADEDRISRQASIDEMARQLAIVDDANCNDTTDSFEEDAIARIGCSFPGGFHVDFALWPDETAMSSFTDRFRAEPEAELNNWQLHAGGPDVGITVEWLEEGDARFFWTYDDRLLTANALLEGGDAARLASWWQTSAALVRE